MSSTPELFTLKPVPSRPNVVPINEHVWVRNEDGLSVVFVHGSPWHRYDTANALDHRIVGATLVLAGLVKPSEIVKTLGLKRSTLFVDRDMLLSEGLAGFESIRRGPSGPSKAGPQVVARARKLSVAGASNVAIAVKLGVSEGTIRRILRDLPKPERLVQTELPTTRPAVETPGPAPTAHDPERLEQAQAEPAPECTSDEPAAAAPAAASEVAEADLSGFVPTTPHPQVTSERDLDRSLDRVFARLGWITEASVCFVAGDGLLLAGALLLIPPLVATGFFQGIEAVYGKLRNGFYGLRHTVMTLALMMALRIPRVEHLKGEPPRALGRLLGLDRAPEVKTLRRRLREITDLGKANRLMDWFAKRLAKQDSEEIAYLYLDGHVRAYYGKHRIAKAFVTQRRLAMPAANDFWLNDVHGQPLLVITGEVTSALTSQLLPILKQLRARLGPGKRATVVFDRGGWSPQLFRQILAMDFDLITYRKGHCPRYPRKDFHERTGEVDGRKVTFLLRDGAMWLPGGGWLRSVVRLREDGKQTAIVTSKHLPSDVEIAFRMFARWRQENYFKYMTEEFDLDALDTYAVEPEDPARTVPNPARARLAKQMSELRQRIREKEAELGRAVEANDEKRRPSTRGFKIAHAALRREVVKLRARLDGLAAEKKSLPERVPVAAAKEEPPMKLGVECKHFMNILKMAVYRAETALARLLDPHFRANEQEGRALLREAFRSSGSIELAEGTLRVTLDPLSAPRRSRAIHALCGDLNDANVRIPGTSLRLWFGVRGEKSPE